MFHVLLIILDQFLLANGGHLHLYNPNEHYENFAISLHRKLLQVGQNVYWTASTVQQTEQGVMADLPTAAQDWYDEVTYPGYTFSDPWQ